MRIALGCMRIPEDGVATIEAALDAGITTFDTARAYAGSEELLGRVLGADPRGRSALVVTKCGMRRPGGGWEPDGRSRTILDDAAKSAAAPADAAREVVLLMGIAGAGKSRLAASYVARGYERLNRDTLGGTLKGIAQKLDERLARGAERIVLDNTYVTRASRADVVRIASMRGAAVGCVHVETPLHEAQVNVVVRMLEKHGDLLGPEAIRAHAKRDPNTLAPGALFRMARELEPPAEDEGFAAIERIPFAREAPATPRRPGMGIPFELVRREDLLAPVPREVPLLVFAWRPPAEASRVVADLAARTGRAIDLVACAHGDGPPVCWCRPPLPGAWLWFSHRRGVGREGSVLVATTAAHRTMAATLGLSVVDAR